MLGTFFVFMLTSCNTSSNVNTTDEEQFVGEIWSSDDFIISLYDGEVTYDCRIRPEDFIS